MIFTYVPSGAATFVLSVITNVSEDWNPCMNSCRVNHSPDVNLRLFLQACFERSRMPLMRQLVGAV